MAINISINTDFGVSATYWNIGAYQEDFKGEGAEVTIYGYASQATRQAGHQPLSAAKVQFSGADYIPDATREQIYNIIKQKPEFTGCTDI
jgi:hypothetical protein